MKRTQRWFFACAAAAVSVTSASAQDASPARALLERAAEAMGGLERLRSLDNLVMTGFGQRYSSNGNISADPNSPPKWQAVADSQRNFDLQNERALLQERRPYMFPFALRSGNEWTRNDYLQTGTALLDHPLPALLEALDPETRLGTVSIEDGVAVVSFTLDSGATAWLGLDPHTHLPYWSRWVTGSATLGDVTNTAYFTGYLPFEGIQLPSGLMTKIDWRGQATSMLQVDSYRIDVDELPAFPAAAAPNRGRGAGLDVGIVEIADGVWDVDVIGGNPLAALGDSGGALIELSDHLVLMEAYGNEAQTLARIDAANELVPGKEVTHLIVSHHHDDHAAGVRGAVSRGITIVAHRRNQALYEEWVSRPAVYFPDELARNPQPLKFLPVDDKLVLGDSTRQLEVYHAVGHMHMSDAVIAYLPQEKIIMEADFTDENYEFNWWGGALQANIDHYGLDVESSIPVHGSPGPIAQKMARTREQVEAARAFCAEKFATGVYPFGCPVQSE